MNGICKAGKEFQIPMFVINYNEIFQKFYMNCKFKNEMGYIKLQRLQKKSFKSQRSFSLSYDNEYEH